MIPVHQMVSTVLLQTLALMAFGCVMTWVPLLVQIVSHSLRPPKANEH